MPLDNPKSIATFVAADPKKPLRIGLIADTHIPKDAKTLPPHVVEAFKDADLILHAGDIYHPMVLDELETIAPVLAVRGNGDWNFPPDHRFKNNIVLNIAGLTLGLTHGINYPPPPQYPFDEVMELAFGNRMDIIVSGDTHVAMVERYNGTLLVNPGSPTLPNGLFELGTVGLLEITGDSVKASIIQLSNFPLPFNRELIYYSGY